MFRSYLILVMLFGLVIGPCAFARGLMAVSGEVCCASVEVSCGPCCPDAPEPQCQCDDADASALLSSLVVLPVSAAPQELLVFLAVPQSGRSQGFVPVAARAPPGLTALRCVVLLI